MMDSTPENTGFWARWRKAPPLKLADFKWMPLLLPICFVLFLGYWDGFWPEYADYIFYATVAFWLLMMFIFRCGKKLIYIPLFLVLSFFCWLPIMGLYRLKRLLHIPPITIWSGSINLFLLTLLIFALLLVPRALRLISFDPHFLFSAAALSYPILLILIYISGA